MARMQAAVIATGWVPEAAGEGPSWPDGFDLVRRGGRGHGGRAFEFSQVPPRCAGTFVALACGRSGVRLGALSQGLFRHAALQAGGCGAGAGGGRGGARASWGGGGGGGGGDTLALRLAHLKYFWLGRPRDMLAS